MGVEVLTHFSKVMRRCALLEVNASFLVIFVCGMRNCWSMSRYTMLVMVFSMKKKGPCTLSLLRAQNTFTFGLYEHVSLYTFEYLFIVVKIFLKHPVLCHVICSDGNDGTTR
jgi:hypothetical protein